MLFNSQLFLFLFLPACLGGFYGLSFSGRGRAALFWLVAASLVFYAWWNPRYLLLLLPSTAFNFWLGRELSRPKLTRMFSRRAVLLAGVFLNLSSIAYFKYAGFFVSVANDTLGTSWHVGSIILPLAISFFTFQQIAYLVDVHRTGEDEPDFLKYLLFVVFFPHLVAGPITHHLQMLPQFRAHSVNRQSVWRFLSVGFSLFVIGLLKKVALADQIAPYATNVFAVAAQGAPITFFEAWGGALAYTFQIYFDFSGYSDMAIGLGYLFGIRLPLNFYSPYRACNIIEFWRRWHISLSHFLRDYLYIPLGGNRGSALARYRNILLTMLIGGLWHGAGWTFVIWGGLHGLYLVVNHGWRNLRKRMGQDLERSSWLGRAFGQALTFFAVVIAWVFFRASSLKAARMMFEGMMGRNGFLLTDKFHMVLNKLNGLGDRLKGLGLQFGSLDYFDQRLLGLLFVLVVVAFVLPNSQQIVRDYSPAITQLGGERRGVLERLFAWRPNYVWSVGLAVTFIVSVSVYMNAVSEFLYFQF